MTMLLTLLVLCRSINAQYINYTESINNIIVCVCGIYHIVYCTALHCNTQPGVSLIHQLSPSCVPFTSTFQISFWQFYCQYISNNQQMYHHNCFHHLSLQFVWCMLRMHSIVCCTVDVLVLLGQLGNQLAHHHSSTQQDSKLQNVRHTFTEQHCSSNDVVIDGNVQ